MSRIDGLPYISALSRRALINSALRGVIGIGALLSGSAFSDTRFTQWVAAFKPLALKRGVSSATYDRVMSGVKPDTEVYALQRRQPEFTEQMWQYINRRCSDWRVITGKERAKEHTSLLARVEKDYGVDRYTMLGLWGMESSFGDVIDNPKYMRPIIPALAALAYGEPRRRRYWEAELINALIIIDRGWAKPAGMIGSWAGAMGHTQWMPEVWLHLGVDYDRDGRANPFGKPDDALAGTARYLIERGNYRRGETWGCEVELPAGGERHADNRSMRSYEAWHGYGVRRADGAAFARPQDKVKLWIPVGGGPAFLIGQNFRAVYSYNPSTSYTLALLHLGDLIAGVKGFHQQFPGGERVPTIDEVKEIQRRLNERGFKTDGVDGRTGSDTVRAIGAFQKSVGMKPDGYAGLKVLARLRQGA
ncbi:MAG TPA: lytic murein transglycosylase [Pseudolabrys sp.]|nr:lytic murein transglycosylase [Pseudolabrys sp.]